MTPPTPPLPAWLEQHIATTTGAPPGARYARAIRCRHCRARVLQGHDDDQAALTVTVDLMPLGPFGEAIAQLAGRRSYALRRTGGRLVLTRRDRWQIQGTPAGTGGRFPTDILAEHRCGQPLPSVASVLTPITRTGVDNGPAPY